MLEKRLSLVGLEGLAEETRVPIMVITNARMGRSISDRNWAKLSQPAELSAPKALQLSPDVVRKTSLEPKLQWPDKRRRRGG
jgi:hypothetical protein